MGLDQSGVLTVGTLVPQEGGHTLPLNTLLVIPPPGVESHRSSLAPQGHYIRAVPMQHMVNKAHTHWVAANLIRVTWFTLVTISMGLQGTAMARAELRKQRICWCLECRTRLRLGISTFTVTGLLQEF